MIVSSNINLIKTSSGLPEYMVPLQNQYRNFSILALFTVIVSGAITLGAFLFIVARSQVLIIQRNSATRKLETLKVKENLFLAAKSRIGIVDAAITSSHPKAVLINNATDVAVPPNLQSIEEDAKQKVVMRFKCGSIEEAITMAGTVYSLYQDKRVKNVNLTNFAIDKNGLSIVFDYTPVWE
jgi:hypothetical protein